MNLPTIKIDKFALRVTSYKDALSLYKMFSNYNIMKFFPQKLHLTLDDTYEFLAQNILSKPTRGIPYQYSIVEIETKKVIGLAGFSTFDIQNKTGSLSILVDEDYQNKGIGTRTIMSLVRLGFDRFGLENIKVSHFENNISSKRMLEKCGFSYVNKTINSSSNCDNDKVNEINYIYTQQMFNKLINKR